MLDTKLVYDSENNEFLLLIHSNTLTALEEALGNSDDIRIGVLNEYICSDWGLCNRTADTFPSYRYRGMSVENEKVARELYKQIQALLSSVLNSRTIDSEAGRFTVIF